MSTRAQTWAVGIATLLASTAAHANGQTPETNGVFFYAGDPHALYVSTTFGLVVSRDEGCTFHWVCESNVGYGGTQQPRFAIAGDGAVFAATYGGLRVSRDGGCSFQTATGELPETDPNRVAGWVDALTIGPTGHVWAATAQVGSQNEIFRSIDNGVTFEPLGGMSATIGWRSLAVAPSDAQRVYATGYQPGMTLADGGVMPNRAYLVHTDDGGASWIPAPIVGTEYGPTLRAVAVDPQNADVVYVVAEGENPPTGDKLYRSADAGITLTQVLATDDRIRDVVIDGARVIVASQYRGSFVSTDGGQTFAALAGAPQLGCLTRRADGVLFGCANNFDPDNMAIARSIDGGATWQKVWRIAELAGPLACAPGTPQYDDCATLQWPYLQTQLGTTGSLCGEQPLVDHTPPTVVPDASSVMPPPPPRAGCCDARGDGALSSAALAGMLAWLRRRRRSALTT